MIISASRRTDIPSYYSEWFFRRISEGTVMVRNPMNFHQVSNISISPDTVECIILWTKNPLPMLGRLDELDAYTYYFQFTLTPYCKNIEPNVPPKDEMVNAFTRLSEMIGKERVIWRYDPVLINDAYDFEYHVRAFGDLADRLCDHTEKVTVSFVDERYRGVRNNTGKLSLSAVSDETKKELLSHFADTAHDHGLMIDACADKADLRELGIGRASCIDDRLISKLTGRCLNAAKDKNQRAECGCVSSVDIGAYNTCGNGCLYCYANYNVNTVAANRKRHDPRSPLICGNIEEGDTMYERKAV